MVSRADSIKSEKQQTKPGMNLFSILKDYIDSMLSEQQGRKALILDEETLGKLFSLINGIKLLYLWFTAGPKFCRRKSSSLS